MTVRKLTFFLLFMLLSSATFAATPNPGHDASRVGAGTFAAGNFTFQNSLTVNGTLFFVNSTGGFVGINTLSPTQKLDVNGSINISGSSGKIYTPEICIAGDCKTAWPTSSGGNVTGGGPAGNISYWTNSTNLGTTPIFISGKYIGINNDTPAYPLQVGGVTTAVANNPQVVINTGSSNNKGLVIQQRSGQSFNPFEIVDHSSNVLFAITKEGYLQSNAGSGALIAQVNGHFQIIDNNNNNQLMIIPSTGWVDTVNTTYAYIGVATNYPNTLISTRSGVGQRLGLQYTGVTITGQSTVYGAGAQLLVHGVTTSSPVTILRSPNSFTSDFLQIQNNSNYTWSAINGSGAFAIGKATPNQALDVNGSINVSSSSGKIYTPEICIAGDCKTAWPSGGSGNISGSGNAGNVSYWSNGSLLGSSQLYVSGNSIGVGTTSPTSTFHVVGTTNISGITFIGSNLTINGSIVSSGGNTRGTNAIDLQLNRSASTQVANGSHAVVIGGARNTASGDYATTVGGYSNTASGPAAVALGDTNTASGNDAIVAGGGSNTASGYYAATIGGTGLTAQGYGQLVIGQYNVLQGASTLFTYGDQALMIGNGSGSGSRRTTFYITNNGNVHAGGTVNASAINTTTVCIGSDCRTSWPSSGGSGNITGSNGSAGYVARWNNGSALDRGSIYDNGSNVGIGMLPYDSRYALSVGRQSSVGTFSNALYVEFNQTTALSANHAPVGLYSYTKGNWTGAATSNSWLQGGYFGAEKYGTGNLTNLLGLYAYTYVGEGNVTNAYSFMAGSPAGASNNYGIYIEAPGNTNSSSYQFYSATTNPVVIRADGKVGIGLKAPTQALHVNGSVNITDNVYYGGNLTGTGADFAERFTVAEPLEAGDVVCLREDNKIERCTDRGQRSVVGVISTAPTVIGNGDAPNSQPVGIVGIVPTKVKGEVHRFDMLTASSTDGYAELATSSDFGAIIGKAMDNCEGGECTINVLVGLQ
jgi:hypothetical protein